MAKQPNFLGIASAPLAPQQRAATKDIMPVAIKPGAIKLPWQETQPVIKNRYDAVMSVVAGNQVTTAAGDGVSPVAGFTLGDATLAMSVLKVDRKVTLRLYFQLGAGSKINGLAKDSGSYNVIGSKGTTYLVLPYKVSKQIAYQFGIYKFTYSTISPASVIAHGNQSAYFAQPRLAAGATELPITIWDLLANPPVYDVSYPFAVWWSAGDYYDLQFEYETDD